MLLCNAKLCTISLPEALGTDFVGQAEWPQFHEPKLLRLEKYSVALKETFGGRTSF